LAALEALLGGMTTVLEELEELKKMDEQIKAELELVKASQAATDLALENLKGDIATQGGLIQTQSVKIAELTEALAAEAISQETKEALAAVVAGQSAIQAKAEELAAINPG
jgi:chromosome segregation ATPase